jgi:hypothetical protein
VTTDPLTLEEYGWLLGQTRSSIRRRQKSIRKQQERPNEDEHVQRRMMGRKVMSLGRAREVEFKLIAMLRAAGREDLIAEAPVQEPTGA